MNRWIDELRPLHDKRPRAVLLRSYTDFIQAPARGIMQSYKELLVWQVAMTLANDVYGVTRRFPREETYGLTSQIRRSAVSMPSNIAEGQGRATRGEFLPFLGHARGSLFELETQLTLAANLEYLEHSEESRILGTLTRVAQLLNALITSLQPSTRNRSTIHGPRSTTA